MSGRFSGRNEKHRFPERSQISNFMKIRPVGAELFHADRQTDRKTDMTKLIVASGIFLNAPKHRYLIGLPQMVD